MKLEIKLYSGYENVEVESIIISDEQGEILNLSTISDSVTVQELLALGKCNGGILELVVS